MISVSKANKLLNTLIFKFHYILCKSFFIQSLFPALQLLKNNKIKTADLIISLRRRLNVYYFHYFVL